MLHGGGSAAVDRLLDEHMPAGTDDLTAVLYRWLAALAVLHGRSRPEGGPDDPLEPHLTVLRYGAPVTCTRDPGVLAAAGLTRGPARECFANAADVADTGRLLYVEGYGLNHLPAIWHAWNHDPRSGVSYDTTWPEGTDARHVGIPITGEAYLAIALRTGGHGILEERTITASDLPDLIHPCADRLRIAAGLPPTGLFTR